MKSEEGKVKVRFSTIDLISERRRCRVLAGKHNASALYLASLGLETPLLQTMPITASSIVFRMNFSTLTHMSGVVEHGALPPV